MHDFLAKLVGLIKRSSVSLPGRDNGNVQTAQVVYLGKVADVEVVYPYGLCGNPPKGSLGLMFNVLAEEENRAAVFNLIAERFKDLKPGEVAVGNYLTRSRIKFLDNGDIELHGVSDGLVTILGDANVEVAGNATVNVGGSVNVTAGSNMTAVASGNVNVSAGGNLSASASSAASITAPTINLNGNVVISGTLGAAGGAMSVTGSGVQVSGTLTSNGKNISNTHTHGGVSTGSGSTGGVN